MSWGIAMSDDTKAENNLEALFAEARQVPARPSEDLMAAILADAAAVQSELGTPPVTQPRERFSLRIWQQFVSAIGGWPAFGGLAAASMAGLWIGISPPAFLPDPVEQIYQISSGEDVLAYNDIDLASWLGEEAVE